MKVRILKLYLTLIFITFYISVFSQDNIKKVNTAETVIDSLKKSGLNLDENQKKPNIILTTIQALSYLKGRIHSQEWNEAGDSLKVALGRLIYEADHPSFDSTRNMLLKYPYDSLSIPWKKFYVWKPVRVKIPVTPKPSYDMVFDTTAKADSASAAMKRDSLNRTSLNLNKSSGILNPAADWKDTTLMVIVDTINEVTSTYSKFPFKYLSYPYQSDSIQAAVRSLINYLDDRDSTEIDFIGIGKNVTPVWINSKSGEVMRYWLKNEFSDSVTIWIGNPSRNTLGLYLEQGVSFRRPAKQNHLTKAEVDVKPIDHSKLLTLRNAAFKPRYWKYRTESSFVLSQISLSNWVKGGESSISTVLDATGYATYDNKPLKLSSDNFVRLNLGYTATGTDGFRKSVDLLETSLKLDHKAFGKFDFSAILLFKTQIAVGRNYFKTAAGNDTSNLVSKFMNPAILTIGLGLDYKPNKTTSIDFSPFSYRGTFVTDTVHIDQTQYGIAKNRKSLNEPGASFMITNEFKPIKTVSIINRLQLFTNYIHNPQNIDVDWEIIAAAKLNWFTDLRFDTHIIYDYETKTVDEYVNGQPVLNPDGTPKKSAKVQFKEMLGLSLSFRF